MVNRRQLSLWLSIYLALGIFANYIYGQDQKNDVLKAVATTSLIASIVQEIGGDRVEVVTIVPSGMCPGHFDIRPEDVKLLEEAQIVLEHGFEGESFVEEMLKSIDNLGLRRIVLDVEGNWMVPEIYVKAIDKVVEALCRVEPDQTRLFKSKALDYKQEIINLSEQIQQEVKQSMVNKVKVVCSSMQAEFVDWLDFEIVATYGRPEEFTPRELSKIIDKAKEADVRLVIDNLQSGAKAGVPIADELKIPHVVLTNFPQDFMGKLSYPKSLKENVFILLQALKE
jgi:zinc transport system substrate-binding protein